LFAFSATDDDLDVRPPYEGWIRPNQTVRTWWMHRHTELECNLVVRGSARYLMHDRTYVLVPGTIVWLFPKQDHLLLEQSPDHCMWTLVVRPELLIRCCTGEQQQVLCETEPKGYFCRRLGPEHAARLAGLLAEVYRSDGDPARYNAGLAYALLCLWAAYGSASESEPGGTIHPAVDTAIRVMSEQPDLRIGELAKRCGLSASQLSRVFHAQIGMPLVRWRSRQTLARFFQLYRVEHRGMQRAAMEAGFGSYSQFHRVFTQLMGCPPAAWQQLQRKGPLTQDDEQEPFTSRT
jgi:AraC-like DNA-binding protein